MGPYRKSRLRGVCLLAPYDAGPGVSVYTRWAGPDLEGERGRSIRLDAETAARLAVALHAVVELVNAHGAPLRAWVTSIVPGASPRAELSPDALRMLALADGTQVEIRAVHSGALSG